jgi:NDP-sugar pyrophosphorylase family protein
LALLGDVLDAMSAECSGVIVAGRDREPAGISIFRRTALDRVSRIGYSDMKEQFIPALHQQEIRIALLERNEPVLRIRDRRSYLQAIASCHNVTESVSGNWEREVDESARVIGPCVIERGASVAGGAIIPEHRCTRGRWSADR